MTAPEPTLAGPARPASTRPPTGSASDRAARLVFIAALATAAVAILYTNRRQWFFLDEWDYLAGRHLSSLDDLLRPHNEHWSTVPIILYRFLFRSVGLRHYWPYQIPVLAAHLGSVALLRTVMVRAGADAWVATASATLLLFLGSGRSDLAWGFQVGFTGALALGLAHLLLVDHDGPLDRRDGLGLLCGLGAIMCSGVGVAMVVTVGAAALIGRGWRAAALHTGPLAAIFLGWYAAYGHTAAPKKVPALTNFAVFDRNLAEATFTGVGHFTAVAVLLAGLLVVSLWDMGRRRVTTVRARFANPIALLVGAVVLAEITALGRARFRAFLDVAVADRYVHLTAALVMPAIAIGATAICRRWKWSLIPLLAVLLAGLPGNIEALTPSGGTLFSLGSPARVVALARTAVVLGPPPSLPADRVILDQVTAGWLVDVVRAGRLPEGVTVTPAQLADARFRFSIEQLAQPPRRRRCHTEATGRPLRLTNGEVLVVRASAVTLTDQQQSSAPSVGYSSRSDRSNDTTGAVPVIVLRPLRPLTISVAAGAPASRSVSVCR